MSNIIVQKFGGSSVADAKKLHLVAERIARTVSAGHAVVSVVSAMGGATDSLLALATEMTSEPPRRELDLLLSAGEQISSSLLAMAVGAQGIDAVALTGRQTGIRTDGQHGGASIVDIDTERVLFELARGRVVIVAGFQGVNDAGEVTTLGRGGSDTSAVALAAALQAERCEIYSDVEGVHSADPRIVPGARLIDEISYEEMQELARCGARVLNRDAVEVARKSGVEIYARSTFADSEGTAVRELSPAHGAEVTGIAGRKDLIRLLLNDPMPSDEVGKRLLEVVREEDIFHDRHTGPALELFISGENLATTDELELAMDDVARDVQIADDVGCVSAVGCGVGDDSPTLRRARAAIARDGIPTMGRFTADDSFTFLIPAMRVDQAIRTLHDSLLGASAA